METQREEVDDSLSDVRKPIIKDSKFLPQKMMMRTEEKVRSKLSVKYTALSQLFNTLSNAKHR